MDKDILELQNLEEDDLRERIQNIDFKMVTFSLGGKDYGIDIMKIKEIAKFSNFTYVPNAPPFVAGVYNLRGDIISIIDLRVMFNLEAEQKNGPTDEDGLILRLEDNVLGVIVDNIDKVIGINSQRIQPPHPIFGDINIKYISGVVENDGRLYIILDVEKIFGSDVDDKSEQVDTYKPAAAPQNTAAAQVEEAAPETAAPEPANIDIKFIHETLQTFKNFHVSTLNKDWIEKRYDSWKKERSGDQLQLQNVDDADAYLSRFYSEFTGAFWTKSYATHLTSVLPDVDGPIVNVWNLGCGKGYESYSLAMILKDFYPDKKIKIWANDNDLLSISTAPNLMIDKSQIESDWHKYLVEGKNGSSFGQEVKDIVLFEFHDVLHSNPMPSVHLVVARDILSFLSVKEQQKMLQEFEEKVGDKGVVVVGDNEVLVDGNLGNWKRLKTDISAYLKL